MFRKIAKKILTKSPKTYTSIHAANFERTHKQDFSKFDEREKELLLDVQKNGYTVIRNFFDNELFLLRIYLAGGQPAGRRAGGRPAGRRRQSNPERQSHN